VRQATFTARASAAGLEVVPLLADQVPHGYREELVVYRELAARICDRENPITGVFAAIDFQIPPLYQALDACGAEPGKGIDIIGCDNAPLFLDRLSPRPATLDINLEMVGYRGIEQLLWRMANPDVKNRTKLLVEPVLVPAEE